MEVILLLIQILNLAIRTYLLVYSHRQETVASSLCDSNKGLCG